MDHTLHKIYDTDKVFYYFFSEQESAAISIRFSLQDRIDRDHLKAALKKTLRRFPNFRQTLVLDGNGELYTMDNSQDVDVYPYDSNPAHFATRETNGYLFRVMYEGDTIWLSVIHGVCDGRGTLMFVRSLIWHYMVETGRLQADSTDNTVTGEADFDSPDMADPFDRDFAVSPAANPFTPAESEKYYILPEDIKGVDENRFSGLFRYVLDTKKLVEQAHRIGTSADTCLQLLIARTIHDSYDTGDKLISGMGAVDLRPFYQSSYLQNFRELFWVYYPPDVFDLSEQEAAELITRLFKKPQLNKNNYDRAILQRMEDYKDLLRFPFADTDSLRKLREAFFDADEFTVTYFTSNLGQVKFGRDIDPFIRHMEVYGPAIFSCPGFFILSHGDETVINLTQRNFSRYFPVKIMETFQKAGLLRDVKLGTIHEGDKVLANMIPVIAD